jgi:hypothetical protein
MRCQSHSGVCKRLLDQTNDEPEKKEKHPMEHETTFSVWHHA